MQENNPPISNKKLIQMAYLSARALKNGKKYQSERLNKISQKMGVEVHLVVVDVNKIETTVNRALDGRNNLH